MVSKQLLKSKFHIFMRKFGEKSRDCINNSLNGNVVSRAHNHFKQLNAALKVLTFFLMLLR